MELEEAAQRIDEAFSSEVVDKNAMTDEESLTLLETIEDPIHTGWRGPGESLAKFLFSTCAKFDRWDGISPVVVPTSFAGNMERALGLFRLVVGQRHDLVSLFEIDVLRTTVYEHAAIVPGRPRTSAFDVGEYRRRLGEIAIPTMPEQQAAYVERRLRLERLLNGMERGSLKSALELNLPYALHLQAMDVTFNWQGISAEVSIQPFLSRERFPGSAVEIPGAAVTAIHVSRWQAATSKIRIQIDGLLDPSYYTPFLRHRAGGFPTPYDGWPSSHTFAFLLLYDLAWELRVNHHGEQHWIPAPADIGQVQYFLLDSVGNQLDMKALAIGGMQATYGEPGLLTLSLGELVPLPWWQKCKAQAALFLDLGDTPEALLWANIAAEALFEERFNEFAADLQRPELAEQLNSPAAVWIEAEEIVSNQFPEMAGKVRWPDTRRHVSMYAKLRYVHKELDLTCTLKETLARYGAISNQRNALFHGASSVRPSADHLVEVLHALEWLDANFRLRRGEGS